MGTIESKFPPLRDDYNSSLLPECNENDNRMGGKKRKMLRVCLAFDPRKMGTSPKYRKLDLQPAEEPLDSFECFLDLRQRGGVAASKVSFALLTEGRAGNNGYLLFFK